MGTMTPEAREAFLAAVHVGVISIEREGRAPIAVPVWYRYEPGGELQLITDENTVKGKALRAAGRFSFCVQDEAPPYKYVSVEGAVLGLDPVDVERDLRPLAQRYLGREGGDQYVSQVGGSDAGNGSILVRMRPEHWNAKSFE